MTRLISILTLILFSYVSFSQDLYIVHCLDGICPDGGNANNDVVVREIFVTSNHESTKLADWVAYKVTRETIGTSASLNRDWELDDYLTSDRSLEPEDYSGAFRNINTDRGHQAPLASFAGTVFWRSTNILSNITPQKSNLNQGPWVALESAVRNTVLNFNSLYVITGPIYDENEEQMVLPQSDKTHSVPTGYFKVIINSAGASSTFSFDQDAERVMDYCSALTTLDDVESAIGFSLFPSRELDEKLGCI